jgi:MFS family permease
VHRHVAQPLTFGGIAGLALTSSTRWWLWRTLVAIIAAAAILLFIEIAWVPVLRDAIARLPEQGTIRHGELHWAGQPPLRVAQGRFLWILIDPEEKTDPADAADLQVELGRTEIRFRSLFGYVSVPYPRGVLVALNRSSVEPWWGAWRPALAAGVGAGIVVTLFGLWSGFGLVYAWPVRLIALYADRRLSWRGAWRLGSASLLPGALFLSLATVAYAFHQINLVQLLFAGVLHLMIGWVYLLFAPFYLPLEPVADSLQQAKNPFKDPPVKKKNPFADPSRAADD